MFYTFTNLQGSQTVKMLLIRQMSFTPLQTYKVLKHIANDYRFCEGFTPLQTYKVLKQGYRCTYNYRCFTPLQTYKVLKLKS